MQLCLESTRSRKKWKADGPNVFCLVFLITNARATCIFIIDLFACSSICHTLFPWSLGPHVSDRRARILHDLVDVPLSGAFFFLQPQVSYFWQEGTNITWSGRCLSIILFFSARSCDCWTMSGGRWGCGWGLCRGGWERHSAMKPTLLR